jgi:twitching motility protein PilJ
MNYAKNRSRYLALLGVLLLAALAAAFVLVYGRQDTAVAGAAPGDTAVSAARAAAVQAREALRGEPAAFQALTESLGRLESIDPATLDADTALLVGQVRSGAAAVKGAEQDILAITAATSELEQRVPELVRQVQDLQSAAGSQPAVSAQLGRLRTLLEALPPVVRTILAGPAKPTSVANRLGQSDIESSQIVLGLQNGDPDLNLKPLTAGRAGEALGRVAAAKDKVYGRVRDVRALGDRLDLIYQSARQLDALALRLVAPEAPAEAAAGASGLRDLGIMGLLIASALLLAAMAWIYFQAAEQRIVDPQAEQSERNQQAILRLLDELSSLADGDLTVQATVSEDITGAIADSINYAVEALRELVTTINESAILLDGAAKQAETTAGQLAAASEAQSKQVGSASQAISRMVNSLEEVSGDAERSSDVARHSVDVAHKGGEAVRRTIEGMNAIRETIQETSKRIKRLGESSQEIGNIVELINDIADQTNILALNASIQASMAGEAGRGFAVVADEVQRLAERSANATKQIEVLVRTIQGDTNEAIVSMERSTTDVVGGALLAENAGAALEEIEQVSSQIASLVQNISNSAQEQGAAASAVIHNVEMLQQINSQTATGTSATRDSISKLAELAAQLRRSVAGFRLPATRTPGRRSREAATHAEVDDEPPVEAEMLKTQPLRFADKKTA